MKNKQINIGAGTKWNVASGSDAVSYFPDSADLPRGVHKALKHANTDALLRGLSRHKIADSGVASVHEVTENPNLVVKIGHEPFSHTAVNVLLEQAWANHPQYSTPRYLGHMVTPHFNATVMSRFNGTQLADVRPGLSLEQLGEIADKIAFTGGVALSSYGVDPGLIAWDLNTRNIIHNQPDELVRPGSSFTIIDQAPTKYMEADEWNEFMNHHAGPARDLRDIEAAESLADQDAFDRFFANH